MHLIRLELSGFKSFAKTTVLEFPFAVTAIVGPNGSGKSNIKEAIQWVLGEQSMKSLRGKKGEDLVWNGSPEVARMGKASVSLVFDNSDRKINVDFDRVALQRKIFRDGANEYLINDSPVRLKDIAETTAHMGLGESKHNIIGQGEVDRVLLSSSRDRYRMLEEALGLRVYHLKKNEALRRLEAVARNTAEAEAVVRELAPHLKFLRESAKKAGTRAGLEAELRRMESEYFSREEKEVAGLLAASAARRSPMVRQEQEVQKEIVRLTRELIQAEQAFENQSKGSGADKRMTILEGNRRELERSLGRLEGRREAEKEMSPAPDARAPDSRYLREEMEKILAAARPVIKEEGRLDVLRARFAALCGRLEQLVLEIISGTAYRKEKKQLPSPAAKETDAEIARAQAEISRLTARIEEYARIRDAEQAEFRARQARVREIDAALRAKQDRARETALEMQKDGLDEERIRSREEDFLRELALSGTDRRELSEHPQNQEQGSGITQEELIKKIQRMRIRLEEIGAIDPAIIKEHEAAEARHVFLTKELEDLRTASASLRALVKELETHMKKDFAEGFGKIKSAFAHYFQLVFSGGKATLRITRQESGDEEEYDGEGEDGASLASAEVEEKEEGVELEVSLPRKRITGLTMLSGGERALASIALLFAISAVNPPPFLILDETDAALDEANSERFSALLKELSKKTQLLVITHNRETMKAAGILYGVTMGHDGVSKLLSLKLEQAEAYTNR